MDDTKNVETDRFHTKKYECLMEFAPEPLDMHKARHKKLTIGNKYPLLARKDEAGHTFIKTIDDAEKEVWVDDVWFIPGNVSLMYDELEPDRCAYTMYNEKGELTQVEFDQKVFSIPDIRAVAEEKGVNPEIEEANDFKEAGILSGICSEDKEWEPESTNPIDKTAKTNSLWIDDAGNGLMFDADKCLAAISRVFGGTVVDPDDVVSSLQEYIPNRVVSWEERNGLRVLTIDEAKTKICYNDVQDAYKGLCNIVSAKQAAKTVCRLIANKVNKLF